MVVAREVEDAAQGVQLIINGNQLYKIALEEAGIGASVCCCGCGWKWKSWARTREEQQQVR
jgi:hypothetical protein